MPPHPHLGWQNPVIDHDFPDPGIYHDKETNKWYAYGTNGNGKNLQASWSDDLFSWHHHDADILPPPYPPWTGKPGFFWAPEVCKPPQGRPGHLMYVSCHDSSTDKMCIGVAYSQDGPLGPFKFISHGPIVSRGETGGCIDPQPFDDPVSGKRYLVFKNDADHMYTDKPQIWIQELSEDGLSLVGERQPLLAPDRSCKWQNGLIEAPFLYFHQPTRTYVLTFSSGTFSMDDYSTGVATSKSLFGPYDWCKLPLIIQDAERGIFGPGGQNITEGPEGTTFVAFHAHNSKGGEGGRRMFLHRLEFDDNGVPHTVGKPNHGHRLRLFAERDDDKWPHSLDSVPDAVYGHCPPGNASGKLEQQGRKLLGKAQRWLKEH